MDTSSHDLSNLFAQLGLEGDPAAIHAFAQTHQIDAHVPITEATFWTAAQMRFLKDCYLQDSDWVPVVDDLNVLLHQGRV